MEAKIRFVDLRLKEAFENLQISNKKLYEEIERALEEINQDVYCGRNVKKKLIPKEFIKKYKINNLWIYNLRSGWRLLYSASNDEIDILALILDWMNHKDYERLFKF